MTWAVVVVLFAAGGAVIVWLERRRAADCVTAAWLTDNYIREGKRALD
jgi:hypothetical protein